tara:strand:- start:6137 stop:7360 length:1224 start_codon:yes stop_codon:yes gene_type:complete
MALVGDDENATVLETLFSELDLDHSLERVTGCTTVEKLRIMAQNQQVLRVDNEDFFTNWDCSHFIEEFKQLVPNYDVVIIADYAKGTVSNADVFISIARALNKIVMVDPKGRDFERYRGASLVTPNMGELEGVVGKCASEEDIVVKSRSLIASLDITGILLTRSENGMTLMMGSDDPVYDSATAKEVFDVTGAGDTVIACMGVCIASGLNFSEAMFLANLAAGVAVGKLGTSSVSLNKLENAVLGQKNKKDKAISTLSELKEKIVEMKNKGRTIVMTNGCFDILHAGHISYLRRARELGDCLVVLINSDDSVKSLKGSSRPINSELDRAAVLLGLTCVDLVCIFSDETPIKIYENLLPDILVKGGDYHIENIVGADVIMASGGIVKVLDFLDGYSSTKIIERMSKES